MNTEQTAADFQRGYTAHMRRVWDGPDADDATYSAAVHYCENCRESCDRLTWIPEFNFSACDRCAEEAFEVFAQEKKQQTELKEVA